MGRGTGIELASDTAQEARRRPRRGRRQGQAPSWDEARLRRELEAYLVERDGEGPRGRFPSRRELAAAGHGGLAFQVPKFGGAARWAPELGCSIDGRQATLDYAGEEVLAEARQLLETLGRLPGVPELRKEGRMRLARAIELIGGARAFVEHHGLPVGQTGRSPWRGQNYWTPERIRAELERVLDRRAATGINRRLFPTSDELEALGGQALRYAVLRHGGTIYWAEQLDCELTPLQRGRARAWARQRAAQAEAE